MITSRLVRAARDIVAEYNRLQIMQHLNAALALSSNRTNPPYAQQANNMRTWAQQVIDQTIVEKYPDDLKDFLKASERALALPGHIARVLLVGYPDNPGHALTTSEVHQLIQLANEFVNELNFLVSIANGFHIEQINVPPDEVSFDVLIPRSVFQDGANDFISLLGRFTKMMSYLTELTTGSEKQPTLVYTSTSDPVTGLALLLVPAMALLTFYSQLLDVATKHISFLKLQKEFREGPFNEPTNLKEEIATAVDKALETAVEKTISSAPNEVPPHRVNEIKIALSKDSRIVMEAIVGGARIGITIESLDKLPELNKEIPGFEPADVNDVLNKQRAIEHRLTQEFHALGLPPPVLIEKVDGDEP
jgi:hypothetical protein